MEKMGSGRQQAPWGTNKTQIYKGRMGRPGTWMLGAWGSLLHCMHGGRLCKEDQRPLTDPPSSSCSPHDGNAVQRADTPDPRAGNGTVSKHRGWSQR